MHELRCLMPGDAAAASSILACHGRTPLPELFPRAAGGHKKTRAWLPPEDRVTSSRLARPFSDLFHVAASRPAKSPRGGINAPVGHESSSACAYAHAEAVSDPTRRLFTSRRDGFE